MNWLEFFFGWLTKKYYETTMLDGIMFWVEFIIVSIVGMAIHFVISERKNK